MDNYSTHKTALEHLDIQFHAATSRLVQDREQGLTLLFIVLSRFIRGSTVNTQRLGTTLKFEPASTRAASRRH